MTAIEAGFEQLERRFQDEGIAGVVEELIQQLREAKRFHDLFEAMKMQIRHRLALPLLYSDGGDELSVEHRDQLEEGLIDACREVGLALIADGHPRDGWMYLRPVGDKVEAAQALGQLEDDDEILDELIEVCLHEGVDPTRGFSLVLQHHGTCNAITTFESLMYQRGNMDLRGICQLLVRHVHEELKASLVADIERQSGSAPTESTVAELVADRDWLFGQHIYHIDTTHLSSTVRFARMLDDRESLELALDLVEYGRRLHEQFQYPGEEPFVDQYRASGLYFDALLGRRIDESKAYFLDRATNVDSAEHGTMAREVFVELLHRLGENKEAVQACVDLELADSQSLGVAPSLMELCDAADDFQSMRDYCRSTDSLLGFGMALLQASSQKSPSAH
jgi:hypothetical protein